MSIPATHQDVLDAQMLGQSQVFVLDGIASGAQTAALTGSGGLTLQLLSNSIGATLPGTKVGPPIAPGTFTGRDGRLTMLRTQGSRICTYGLGNFIKLGQIDFTATGSRFTHHSSGGPYTKNQMGVSAPVAGHIFLDFVTAMSGVAAVINTHTFVDQDGTTIVNSGTWTAPAATTALGSGFILPLDAPASGARDLTSVNVSTASTTGVADVYLLEMIELAAQQSTLLETINDAVFGGFTPELVNPPVATTGTASVQLLPYAIGTNSGNTPVMSGTIVTAS